MAKKIGFEGRGNSILLAFISNSPGLDNLFQYMHHTWPLDKLNTNGRTHLYIHYFIFCFKPYANSGSADHHHMEY